MSRMIFDDAGESFWRPQLGIALENLTKWTTNITDAKLLVILDKKSQTIEIYHLITKSASIQNGSLMRDSENM